jgi:hypothetical protein
LEEIYIIKKEENIFIYNNIEYIFDINNLFLIEKNNNNNKIEIRRRNFDNLINELEFYDKEEIEEIKINILTILSHVKIFYFFNIVFN